MILIIEDEPQIRRFLRAALTESGYRLLEADSGKQGLTHANPTRPCYLLTEQGVGYRLVDE